MTSLFKLIRTHWLAIVLVSLGTWLRFTQLPDKGILFGDSGRDLLVAAEAVNRGQLPLLGIASSVPRFHQGPLTIWISMVIYRLVGYQPVVYYWVFAGIGSLALIAVYEFCLVWINRRVGLMALALLSLSPLAIAHSRMIYHTVPIAFWTVVSLWALARVWEHRRWSWWWAGLATALLFQHELSLFPIFVAIPLAWWGGTLAKGKSWQKALKTSWQTIAAGLLGVSLGLWPQVLSEVKDRSHQLSGFALWLGYRLISFFLPGSGHFGFQTFGQALQSIVNHLGWVLTMPVSVGWQLLVWVMVIVTIGWGSYRWWQKGRHIQAGPAVVILVTILISLGYIFHGAPSEAYFPVYCVLLPLVFALSWAQLPTIAKWGGVIFVGVLGTINVINLQTHQFLVNQPTGWSYGPGFGVQRQVLTWAIQQTNNPTMVISSHTADAAAPHYLDSYIWVGRALKLNLLPQTDNSESGRHQPEVAIDYPPTESQPLVFTNFHSVMPWSKTFYLESVIVRLTP